MVKDIDKFKITIEFFILLMEFHSTSLPRLNQTNSFKNLPISQIAV